MAKSMSLNPGADATLVAAATKAAMANVPQDLSKQFESLAQSYDDSMQAIATAADKIAGKLVPLAANMVKDAIKERQTETKSFKHAFKYKVDDMRHKDFTKKTEGAPGWSVTTDDKDDPTVEITEGPETKKQSEETEREVETTIGDELVRIRKERRKLWGKTDRASKIKRQELKTEKEKLYSEIEWLDKADTATTEMLASGNFDENATGQKNMVMAAALQAYKTKSGKITEGPYEGYHVSLSRNDNSDMVFTLKDSKGNVVTGENADGSLETGGDKPFAITSSQAGSLLVPKYDEAQYEKLNKIMNDTLSKSNVQDYSKINFRNRVVGFVNNENSLLGLMNRALGAHPTSFVDEINSSSETSAGYFASLGSVKLEKLGVTDSDGDGVIGDEGDFANVENYKKVKDALLDKSNKNYNWKQTQAAFLDYADEVGKKMHNFVPKGSNNNNTNTTGKSYVDAAGAWVDFETQDSIVSKALAGESIWDWKGIKYTTDDNGATYTIDNEKLQKKYPQYVNMSTTDLLSGKRFGLSNRIAPDTKFGGGTDDDDNSSTDYSIDDLFESSKNFSLSGTGLTLGAGHEDQALNQLRSRLGGVKGLKFKITDDKGGVDHVTATLNGKKFPINLEVPANKVKETIADFEAWVKTNK